jgi:Hemopexin
MSLALNRVYFFQGTQYSRYQVAADQVDAGYPLPIAGQWAGLPGAGINAAVNWGNGKVYFFSGSQYYRFDVVADAVDPGYPLPIAGHWPGLTFASIDAAVNWGNGKAYFFSGSQYARYDVAADATDPGYPLPIAGNWANIAGTGFENGIDAAIDYGTGKAYFFRGGNYVRVDIAAKAVDPGYPLPIAGNWTGLFSGALDAAVEWPVAAVSPGGFRVPTARSGCKTVAAGTQRKVGESFALEVDFESAVYATACAVGEYRQFVRGQFTLNGSPVNHLLANPAGGAPLPLLPTPPPGAAADNFREDGIPPPLPSLTHMWYGHRAENTAGNADTSDRYLPDRATGCQYRGTDFPSLRGPPGMTYSVQLDFRGQAIDSGTGGAVVATNDWSVNCSGTL